MAAARMSFAVLTTEYTSAAGEPRHRTGFGTFGGSRSEIFAALLGDAREATGADSQIVLFFSCEPQKVA